MGKGRVNKTKEKMGAKTKGLMAIHAQLELNSAAWSKKKKDLNLTLDWADKSLNRATNILILRSFPSAILN